MRGSGAYKKAISATLTACQLIRLQGWNPNGKNCTLVTRFLVGWRISHNADSAYKPLLGTGCLRFSGVLTV